MASVAVNATARPAVGSFAVGQGVSAANSTDAVTAAIDAALLDETIAGDVDALAAVTLIQTTFASVLSAISGDVQVIVNTSNIATRSKLRDALNQIGQHFESGVGGLTP